MALKGSMRVYMLTSLFYFEQDRLDYREVVGQNGGSLMIITNREWGLGEGAWERKRRRRPGMLWPFNLILLGWVSFHFSS